MPLLNSSRRRSGTGIPGWLTRGPVLALRLQWFESTPTQASPRAILQVFKPLDRPLAYFSRREMLSYTGQLRQMHLELERQYGELRPELNSQPL